MAGSFLHLHLGQNIQRAWAWPPVDSGAEAAFYGSTLAPDIGFFPQGPRSFSEAVHHVGTGAFLRALLQAAATAEEKAFVAGWATHIYADAALHPYINQLAADKANDTGLAADLWHLRLEWGMDCLLLEGDMGEALWNTRIRLPSGQGNDHLLSRVGQAFYGDCITPSVANKGWNGVVRWMGRLPWIYLLSGGTRPGHRSRGLGWLGRGLGGVARAWVVRPLQHKERWCDMAAALAVWRPAAAIRSQLLLRSEAAMQRLAADWEKGFADLPDLDLDTGREVA